jgi:hypothetical protein
MSTIKRLIPSPYKLLGFLLVLPALWQLVVDQYQRLSRIDLPEIISGLYTEISAELVVVGLSILVIDQLARPLLV